MPLFLCPLLRSRDRKRLATGGFAGAQLARQGKIPFHTKTRFYCVTGYQKRSDEAMAVFRVERNRGYTVMSNHHLRNKELTLKAKGLLSQMLSLPEDWDYTLAGLSHINRESIDAIRTSVWEFEKAGYITRRQGHDEKGKMTAIEYTIYEQPQPPLSDNPALENPTTDKPILEKPTTDNPTTERPTQLNKEIQRTDLPTKEKIMTDEQSTHSIPIHSPKPFPYAGEASKDPERKRKEASTQSAVEVYREIIKDNIDYDILMPDNGMEKERISSLRSKVFHWCRDCTMTSLTILMLSSITLTTSSCIISNTRSLL